MLRALPRFAAALALLTVSDLAAAQAAPAAPSGSAEAPPASEPAAPAPEAPAAASPNDAGAAVSGAAPEEGTPATDVESDAPDAAAPLPPEGAPAGEPPASAAQVPEPAPRSTPPAGGAVAEVSPPPYAPRAPDSPAPPAQSPVVEVTVVGTPLKRTAGSAHVVRSAELERFEYDDPHKALTSVPGVYVRSEDGFGLRPNIGLRGANPDRSKKVTLMEDGVLFGPAPYSAPAAYFFPLLTRMTQIRVLKGPSSIGYGPQTVGGAIDFVTRAVPTGRAAMADLSAGQYGYGKAHVYAGVGNEQYGFLIEGVRLQNDGFKKLPSGADTGFTRNEWMLKSFYVFDPSAHARHELRFKASYSDELSNETYLGLTDRDLRASPYQRYAASELDQMKSHRYALALTHVFDLGRRLNLTTTAYRNTQARTWRKVNGLRSANLFDVLLDPSSARSAVYYDVLRGQADSASAAEAILIGPNQREFLAQGLDTRLRWDERTGAVSHRVELGARYHYDSVERRHSENGFLMVGGQLVPDGGPTVVTAFNKGSTHAVALHALYALSYRGLTVTPGLRTELIRSALLDRATSQRTTHFAPVVLPGLGLYYDIYGGLGVLAGVYRGFSPPPPGAQRGVKPELSGNYELGARFTRGQARLEGIGFWNAYTNLTNICTYSSGCTQNEEGFQSDLGRARIYGAEALGEYAPKLGPISLPVQLVYTYTATEFLTSFRSDDPVYASVQRGDQMPYVPRHQLRLGAGVEHARFALNGGFTYVPPTREVPSQGDARDVLHSDAQPIFDLGASAKVWRQVSLYATAQNLFGSEAIASHRPFGARPVAPRWVQVGLKAAY